MRTFHHVAYGCYAGCYKAALHFGEKAEFQTLVFLLSLIYFIKFLSLVDKFALNMKKQFSHRHNDR